jgi:transposase
MEGRHAQVVMADAAQDADPPRQASDRKGAVAVPPNRPRRTPTYPFDRHLCAQRHLMG